MSYHKSKLAAARIFQMLKDQQWFARNTSWMEKEGVEKWNHFSRCYNRECLPEWPTALALIYAATQDYQRLMRGVAQQSTRLSFGRGENFSRVFAHSIALWNGLLSITATAGLAYDIDISSYLLPDGSSALGKLLTIANLYEYEFANYENKQAACVPVVDASTSSFLQDLATFQFGQRISSICQVISASIDKAYYVIMCFGAAALVLAVLMIGLGEETVPQSYLT